MSFDATFKFTPDKLIATIFFWKLFLPVMVTPVKH